MRARKLGLATWIMVGLGPLAMEASAAPPEGTVSVAAKPPPPSVDAAEAAVARVDGAKARVRHMLDEARREKDVVKTVCLSDKLAQLQVASKSMRDRTSSLKSAITRGDIDLANHETSVLAVLRQRGEVLEGEASVCIGEPILRAGSFDSKVYVDPNIAPVDPGLPGESIVVIVPPLPASGFK